MELYRVPSLFICCKVTSEPLQYWDRADVCIAIQHALWPGHHTGALLLSCELRKRKAGWAEALDRTRGCDMTTHAHVFISTGTLYVWILWRRKYLRRKEICNAQTVADSTLHSNVYMDFRHVWT
jgi:hypothetical protein